VSTARATLATTPAGKEKAPGQNLTLRADRRLLLVATLVASLAKQLAVLLLRHALATLLDYGTHTHLTLWLHRVVNELPGP